MNIVLPSPVQDPGMPSPSFECSASPPLIINSTSTIPVNFLLPNEPSLQIDEFNPFKLATEFILTLNLNCSDTPFPDGLSSSVLLPL